MSQCHGGLPHPPDDLDALPAASMSPNVNHTPHHWRQGPMDVQRAPRPFYVRASDGRYRRMTHRFTWYLDRVEGTTTANALRAIYAHLRHPRSWERSGVAFVRTYDKSAANIWLRIIPADETRCGPGSAGCYSYGYEAKPVAEVGVEYINRPDAFAVILGMELCGHGMARCDDMYTAVHQPYVGVLGDWRAAKAVGYYPSDEEIADARLWLAGKAPRVHRD